MRVVGWLLGLALPLVFGLVYMFVSAHKSGVWLDAQFRELESGWSAEVLLRHVRVTGSKKAPEGLQVGLDQFKPLQLKETSRAACTHGLKFETTGSVPSLRSQCIVLTRFANDVTHRWEFELSGFWDRWQITGIEF